MKPKTILIEASILVSILMVIFTGAGVIFNSASIGQIDLGLHDTYLTLYWKLVIFTPFLLLSTIVYFIKEAFYRFKRNFQNWLLVVTSFILLEQLLNNFIRLGDLLLHINPDAKGWTIYPPLSALGNEPVNPIPNGGERLLSLLIVKIISFPLIITLLIALIFISIMIGRNQKTTDHEAPLS